MRLQRLLRAAGLAAPAGPGPDVVAVEQDSRRCRPGAIFVAVPGLRVDGHRFAADAVRAGAVAVVAERPPDPPIPASTPLVLAADCRRALSALAAELAGHPSRRMIVAGITGTDGKTTTTTMLWAAWRAAGERALSLTTVDRRIGDEVRANPEHVTTLEAPELHALLAEGARAGCSRAAVETSSHALLLHRVDDVDYDVAVYTRITSEHLDLHGTREAYLRSKARLLELVGTRAGGLAVLDRDDDFAFPVLARAPVSRRLTCSVAGAPDADLVLESAHVVDNCVHMVAATPWGRASIDLRMAGRFNAANALAALGAACGTGAPLEDAARGIAALEAVPGRMERVALGQPFTVLIDYAHTAAALEAVLAELRPATRGRLWVVFGSAGERDREKRPAMGAVAARLADALVITDEDPRGEDRMAILEEIAAGAEAAGAVRGDRLHIVPDRAEAIWFAVGRLGPGDTLVLAGKGHERTIEVEGGALPWDERAAAERALRRLGWGPAP